MPRIWRRTGIPPGGGAGNIPPPPEDSPLARFTGIEAADRRYLLTDVSSRLDGGRKDSVTYRFLAAAGAAVLVIGAAACGGYDSPTSPGGTSEPPAGAIVINIVATNGSRSFSPDPATVPSGQTVVWRNRDTTTHRVVLDDRGLDTGNIAAGAFSAPMTLAVPGPYHCSIHPEMIGAITDR